MNLKSQNQQLSKTSSLEEMPNRTKKTDLSQKLNNSKAERSQKQSLCEQFHADNQKLHKNIQELQNQ